METVIMLPETKNLNIEFQPYNSSLGQNNNGGFEYSMLDKNNKATYSPIRCRDILNGLIYSEKRNFETNIDCFLRSYKPTGKLFGEKTSKLAIRINDNIFSGYGGIITDEYKPKFKDLSGYIDGLTNFINYFDEARNYEKTIFTLDADNNAILVEFDNKWLDSPYYCSIFSILLRVGISYENEGVKQFLDNLQFNKKILVSSDVGIIKSMKTKLDSFIAGKLVKQTYESLTDINHVKLGLQNYTVDYTN